MTNTPPKRPSRPCERIRCPHYSDEADDCCWASSREEQDAAGCDMIEETPAGATPPPVAADLPEEAPQESAPQGRRETVATDHPSRFITWEDIDGLTEQQRTVEIDRVDLEEFESINPDTKKREIKVMRLVYFKNHSKPLGMCKVVKYLIAYQIKKLAYSEWPGSKVTLIVRQTHAFGSIVNCVRVKVDPNVYEMARKKCQGRNGKHVPWIDGPA